MKKQFLTTICLVAFITIGAFAQKSESAFSKDNSLLNIGVGLGSPFFGSGYSSSLPVNPTISFEKGVTDEISVGGQLSYASSKYSASIYGSSYSYKASATYIGARGSYHLNDALDIDSKFDLYGGLSLGYVVVSVSDSEGYSASAASGAGFGAFAGGKYYFAPKTGLFAEVGYQSLAFLSVGVNFKF